MGADDGDSEIGQLRGLVPAGSRARRQLDMLLRRVGKAIERHVLGFMVIRWMRSRLQTHGSVKLDVVELPEEWMLG